MGVSTPNPHRLLKAQPLQAQKRWELTSPFPSGGAKRLLTERVLVKEDRAEGVARALSLTSSQPWRLYKSSGTAILRAAPTIPHTAPPPPGHTLCSLGVPFPLWPGWWSQRCGAETIYTVPPPQSTLPLSLVPNASTCEQQRPSLAGLSPWPS